MLAFAMHGRLHGDKRAHALGKRIRGREQLLKVERLLLENLLFEVLLLHTR